MIFKKLNLIYFLITIVNITIFFRTISFSKYNSNFCLITDIKTEHQQRFIQSNNEKSYFKQLKSKLEIEVIDLEKQRANLLLEIASKTNEFTKLYNEVNQYSIKSYRIRNSIISLSQIRKDYQKRHKNSVDLQPIISKFKSVSTSVLFNVLYSPNKTDSINADRCSIYSCFNFENCALKQSNILSFTTLNDDDEENDKSNSTVDRIKAAIKNSGFYSSSNASCVSIIVSDSSLRPGANILSNKCDNLNCLSIGRVGKDRFSNRRSMICDWFFRRVDYRNNYDIVIPIIDRNTVEDHSIISTMIFPIRRRYLLSFTASMNGKTRLPKLDRFVVKYLQNISDEIQKETGNNNFYFDINCIGGGGGKSPVNDDWNLCENTDSRLKRLLKSKFCLILSHWDIDILSTGVFQRRLFECLLTGSVPVILGDVLLPFQEIIDWKKSVLQFPKQRVVEIVSLLEKISDNELFAIKLHNRHIFQLHFVDLQKQIDSIGFILTKRIGLALPNSKTFPSKLVYGIRGQMFHYNFTVPNFPMEMDPYLGPNNIPATNSTSFGGDPIRSSIIDFGRAGIGNTFHTYPSTPWDTVLPTDSILRGYSTRGYFGINHSVNEAGTEFIHSLGGNHIYEQFTLVILAFKRHNLLKKSLEMLNDLPYLHSIVVIWNDPSSPPVDFKWPKLHVDLKVVKSNVNSLNSRFLPYDLIQTDAVLSFDDDIQLRHDEIIFAFRVWRENRDRIVGFPARYHNEYPGPAKVRYASNQWWMYNSNYTCEYSMVLTGAAFFHRFYLFAYSNDMNPAIREIVDKYNNCEDIAMNFLVSHITGKPPLKVTVRWTFSCVNCDTESGNSDESLHNRPNHYQIRNDCINKFSAIYGYNPLLYSQYRADSVLFKTRLPVDKQKCFRYV